LVEGTEDFIINPPDYQNRIRDIKELYIQFYSLTFEVESNLLKILHRYLELYDLLYMKDVLYTVVKELVNNAIKANLKRVYFDEKKLDISSPEEYRRGMETFKDEVYGDERRDFDQLKKNKKIVRVSFIAQADKMIIHVINNVPILDEELVKIDARAKKAYNYNDISEAFEDVLDDSEGAGLGLIMALMLFKNSGLPRETFTVLRKNNQTVAAIKIPQMINRTDIHVKIADEVVREVENIPAFPGSIREIQKLCANPDSSIKIIAENIKRDASLTANLMKIANSAGYMSVNRADTIEEAVMKIGMKGINTLLVASGVQNIMESRYKKFEAQWINSYKNAFYAQRIALEYKMNAITEHAYLAALMAHIGNIILLTIRPEIGEKIREIVGIKGLSDTSLFEEISLGMSHSTLSSAILRKWNFNEALVQAVEYHHRPHVAPEKYRELTYCVYLSSAFLDIEERKTRYELLDEEVLTFFRLGERENFNKLMARVKKQYQEQTSGSRPQQ
jgi:HD-like signal output (HDOD) protein